MDEMKTCKYCQSEIPKAAKICPNCRKKQKGKGGLIAIIVIVVILIIGIAAGGSDDDKKKVDNSGASATTESASTADTKDEDDGTVLVGGSFEDNGLKFTVDAAEIDYKLKDNSYGFYDLDDGLVYLKVDFTFENTGDSDKYVSIYDFDCYANNTACEQQYVNEGGDFINTNLSAGRNVSFTCFYAVPADAETIDLEYTENVFSSKKVVVKIK